mmetsp:Transcript_194/g.523  ORF Transcript_194/g.523 Transcript_194/m.523 type:complete len:360 (+) Transcript_194:892-1971(+)
MPGLARGRRRRWRARRPRRRRGRRWRQGLEARPGAEGRLSGRGGVGGRRWRGGRRRLALGRQGLHVLLEPLGSHGLQRSPSDLQVVQGGDHARGQVWILELHERVPASMVYPDLPDGSAQVRLVVLILHAQGQNDVMKLLLGNADLQVPQKQFAQAPPYLVLRRRDRRLRQLEHRRVDEPLVDAPRRVRLVTPGHCGEDAVRAQLGQVEWRGRPAGGALELRGPGDPHLLPGQQEAAHGHRRAGERLVPEPDEREQPLGVRWCVHVGEHAVAEIVVHLADAGDGLEQRVEPLSDGVIGRRLQVPQEDLAALLARRLPLRGLVAPEDLALQLLGVVDVPPRLPPAHLGPWGCRRRRLRQL